MIRQSSPRLNVTLTLLVDDITKGFPQFPQMHRLLSLRPNQVPIAITTALGPSGPTTVFHQPPSDAGSDEEPDEPVDVKLSPHAEPLSVQEKDTKAKKTEALPSTQLRSAALKAASSAKSTHAKRGIEERFVELHSYVFKVSVDSALTKLIEKCKLV